MLTIIAILLVLTAAFAYVNERFLKWPATIGAMAIALAFSLLIVGLDLVGIGGPRRSERALLASIDFTEVLMGGMLSVLLFAGALQVDLERLRRLLRPIGVLAIVGTAFSSLVIGLGCWWLLRLLGIDLSFTYCLLFGALISPTDPIAVLGILSSAKVPADLEDTITGESLINDGVGVVIFALLLEMLHSGSTPTPAAIGEMFLREAAGGVLFGIVVGTVINRVLASIDNYRVEVLITLATVIGGYAVCDWLETSGPLAMVAIGLLVGNEGRALSMSDQTRERLDIFWHLLDEILNSVLFVLLGLEVAVIRYQHDSWLAAISVVLLSLIARFLAVGLPVLAAPGWFGLPTRAGWLLTWSGVRGGISVALALSLPPGPQRDTVLMLTYSVVVFSILVQGLSIGAVARRLGLTGGRA